MSMSIQAHLKVCFHVLHDLCMVLCLQVLGETVCVEPPSAILYSSSGMSSDVMRSRAYPADAVFENAYIFQSSNAGSSWDRVRMEAAMALGQTAGRSTNWSGLDHLLKMYRTRAYDSALEAPRPWNFADLAEHYVNQVCSLASIKFSVSQYLG